MLERSEEKIGKIEEPESFLKDEREAVINAGFFKEIGKTPILSLKEQAELVKKAKQGDKEAEEKIILSNLRLVVKVAQKNRGRGLDLMDLIQEGSLGLKKAINLFNPKEVDQKTKKEIKFSTYAYHVIDSYIKRSLTNTARLIRIPAHMKQLFPKYISVSSELVQKLGREPTVAEIAKVMVISPEKAKEIRNLIATKTLSLDAAIKGGEAGEGGESMIDFIEDKNQQLEKDIAGKYELLEDLISDLNEREKDIVRLRFGLSPYGPYPDGESLMTFQKIGDKYGITRQVVNQTYRNILKKLKKKGAKIMKKKGAEITMEDLEKN